MTSRRRIGSSRLREIEQRAASTRREAEDTAAAIYDAPAFFDLVTALGYGLKIEPNLEHHDGTRLAGWFRPSDLGGTILCEAYDPEFRQRFSAAHEIGHAVLHEVAHRGGRACAQSRVDPESDESGRDHEAEADAFAAAFLMPEDDFRQAVDTVGYCDGFLAEHFGVSLTAVRRRWGMLSSGH